MKMNESGKLSSVYIFLAEDSFMLDRSLQHIRTLLSQKHPGFEEIHWNPEQKNIANLLEELGSLSFFSKHQLIRIEGDEFCREEELNKILLAMQNNSTHTLCLIPKKKTALNLAVKILKPLAELLECEKPKVKDLPTFILKFAEAEGKKISSTTAQKLIDLLGTDLMVLKNQIKLLAIFVGDKKEITISDVQTLFADSSEKDIFNLTQYMLQNNPAKTFTLLRQLLSQGEVPLVIFSLLVRHYRVLMKIKLLERKRMDAFEMAQIVRLPAFVIEKNLPQARQLSWKKLIQIYQDLSKTDILLKSSSMPHLATLEKFVWGSFSL